MSTANPESAQRGAPIRVVVADDDAIVRSALCLLLEAQPDFEVVGEAGDPDAVVARAGELTPTVVLLDLWMSGRSSVEAIPALLAVSPLTRVVMLTSDDDIAAARQALQAGAAGYVLKRADHRELATAIRAAAAGERYVQPDVGARLAVAPPPAPPGDELSKREREVVSLLAQGLTNAEIAAELKLSVRTVESHRARIQQKLGVFGRSNLVRYAREHGLSVP